jgi:8-hydroxy-5-deazaflavin:NADPH oxidoreductase
LTSEKRSPDEVCWPVSARRLSVTIAIIGGGAVGSALGSLLHNAGRKFVIGRRSDGGGALPAATIEQAIDAADIVILAVPFTAARQLLPAHAARLAGKILVDATNPLNEDWSPLLLGEENSAGEEVARLVPEARVVKAFNTIFADVMRPDRQSRNGQRVSAFVASDDDAAAEEVSALAQAAGFEPVWAGPMASARWLEAMAHLNIRLAVTLGGGTDAAFVYHRAN